MEDLYYTSSSSSSSSSSSDEAASSSSDDEDDSYDQSKNVKELVINIRIDDKDTSMGDMPSFELRCGTGRNTFKWLAMTATQRYTQLAKSHGYTRMRERYHSTPGNFSPSVIKQEDKKIKSSALDAMRRRSLMRHGSILRNAVQSNALKIDPRSSLRELLSTGDTVTVVVSAHGNAFCEKDGRFVARPQPAATPFEGAAFHTSSAGQARHEKFKQEILELQQTERQKRMALAADVLFGEAASELKSRDIAGEAAQREHLMHTMFNDDWMKVDLHGILKKSDRPQVAEVLKDHYSLILKVFDHFSTMGIDFVFQAVNQQLIENVGAQRATIWVADYINKELWTKVASGTEEAFRIPMTSGIVGDCVTTGKSINIPNAYKDSRFNSDFDRKSGFVTRQILCVPAKSINGKVLGALQIINRKKKLSISSSSSSSSNSEEYKEEEEGENNEDRERRIQSSLRRSQSLKQHPNKSAAREAGAAANKNKRLLQDDLRPFSREEQIDVEHVANRFGREIKATSSVGESKSAAASDPMLRTEKALRTTFDDLDKNKNGTIEFREMCTALRNMGVKLTDKQMRRGKKEKEEKEKGRFFYFFFFVEHFF